MLTWVQTVVATKPVNPEKISLLWKLIYDSSNDKAFDKSPLVQLWVATQDLKESFESIARRCFGENLQQIIRFGSGAQIEYNVEDSIT